MRFSPRVRRATIDVVEMRIVDHDRRRIRLDDIIDLRVGIGPPQRAKQRRRENDVADQAEPDEENSHASGRQGLTILSSLRRST